MKNSKPVLVIGLVLLVVATAVYLKRPQPEQPAPVPRQASPAPAAQPAPEPAIRYPIAPDTPAPVTTDQPAPDLAPESPVGTSAPIAPPPEPESLPALDDSDAALSAALGAVFATGGFEQLLYPDRRIRRLVVSVDNLPGKQFPRSNYRVARSTPGLLLVTRETEGDEERLFLSPDNYARYELFIALADSIDSAALVAVYRRFYPLFQAAYENLGYPSSAYFNDRLVDVIDELLATPEVSGRIELVRPHVLYRFADPALERLSAGQKVLLRVGPENAHKLRLKLQEIRHFLVGGAPAG
jgi:hypothetical protein